MCARSPAFHLSSAMWNSSGTPSADLRSAAAERSPAQRVLAVANLAARKVEHQPALHCARGL
eukprot:CAMPEP_0170574872 /NCGR_PEP_ID=MMETSP0224-20130122/3538_1 /TAXON_ID=285029 /ORGANISM="Togula jolla, Strain CCCM 725" /LENGTH=61 /DNA_ID=CAMNT_0010897571 /DNA_START=441 /DNA_END=627 /DNA_ORIENTATION=+